MGSDRKRVEWTEMRPRLDDGTEATFRVIAELINGDWRFLEKEPCEVRWFDAPATLELIAKAEELLQIQKAEALPQTQSV